MGTETNSVILNGNLKSPCIEVDLSLENEFDSNEEISMLLNGSAASDENEASDSSSITSTRPHSFSLRNLSSQQKFVLASSCWSDFSSYMCLSVMAPFFPEEALAKNIDNTISGWIFGTYALTQVFFSPLFGRMLPKVGPRFLYLAGSFLAGGCTVLFGPSTSDFSQPEIFWANGLWNISLILLGEILMAYVSVENGTFSFVLLCFILRVFLAIGCAAQQTASFTIRAIEFPDTITTVFGIGEVFVGIGTMAGPALGGAFYGLGGFELPFYVLGGTIVAILPINMWMLPKDAELKPSTNSVSYLSMLKLPMTVIASLDIVVVAVVWAILDPTLEPHLRDFDLTPEIVGVIFLLMAAFYAVSSPIWGWLAEKMPDNRYLLIPGFVITAVGSMLLGPSPFLGLDDELWLNMVALIILGVSTSMALIPTFGIYIDLAEQLGIEDDLTIYSVVAGLWGSMYALGDFIGPALGGFLIDRVGFDWMMTYTAAACTVMAGLLSLSWFYEGKCSKKKKKKLKDLSNCVSNLKNNTENIPLLSEEQTIPEPFLSKSTLTNVPNVSPSPTTSLLQNEMYFPPVNADIMGNLSCMYQN